MKTENLKTQNETEKKIIDPEIDFWMDKREVLEKLHISSRTLQTWRSSGRIPYKKIGRKIYYWYSDLIELLKTKPVSKP
jgi:hypothetical protein